MNDQPAQGFHVPDFPDNFPPEMVKDLSPNQVWLYKTIQRMDLTQRWQSEKLNELHEADHALHAEVCGMTNDLRSQIKEDVQQVTAALTERTDHLEKSVDERLTRVEVGISNLTDRVDKAEAWKQFFSGKWSVIASITILIVTALAGSLCTHFLKPIGEFVIKHLHG